MKYTHILLAVLGFFILQSNQCGKDKTPPTPVYIGTYNGLLYTETYVAMTGSTTRDTLSTSFIVSVGSTDFPNLDITSTNEFLNNVIVEQKEPLDSTYAFWGNDMVYENNLNNVHGRVYYLLYNYLGSSRDSVYIESYLPPQGGWNSKLIYKGTKNR